MATRISIIAAIAHHQVIGLNNTLPWHLPQDLKRFRALTMGHHIIMGRKTYQSLDRLLPGRTTVIVSRNKDFVIAGALMANSLTAALEKCANDDEVFIIGGAQLYQDALPRANRMYLTEIDADFAGDTFFPQINESEWVVSSHESHTQTDNFNFNYVVYDRK